MQEENVTGTKSQLPLPAVIGIVSSLLLVVCLVLPYAVATSSGETFFMAYSGQSAIEGLDMTADQMASMSLVDFARVYSALGSTGHIKEPGALYIGLVATMGACSLVMALCFAKRRPIVAIAFGIIAFGAFMLQTADYTSRGVVPSDNYGWGIAYYLAFAAFVVALVAAIWLFVERRRNKR